MEHRAERVPSARADQVAPPALHLRQPVPGPLVTLVRRERRANDHAAPVVGVADPFDQALALERGDELRDGAFLGRVMGPVMRSKMRSRMQGIPGLLTAYLQSERSPSAN